MRFKALYYHKKGDFINGLSFPFGLFSENKLFYQKSMDLQHSVLVLGAGGIGERHVRCFQQTTRATVFICEPNKARREEMAARYKTSGFSSLEEALQNRKFSTAVICTPAPTHIPLAETCMEAGLHVLIEKPLATSLEGVDSLLETERKTQRVARVAYVYRSIPAVERAREIIQSGRLGVIKHIAAVSGQNYPTFRPDYRQIYYAKRESGGGAMQDVVTHLVHGVEWIMGPITDVACMAYHQVLEGVEVDDTVNLICLHEAGCLTSFALNQFQAPNESRILFHGEKASLSLEIVNQRIGLRGFGDEDWSWEVVPHGERDAMFITQANSFLDAVEGKSDHLSGIADALQTLKVNLAALKSSDTRAFVKI